MTAVWLPNMTEMGNYSKFDRIESGYQVKYSEIHTDKQPSVIEDWLSKYCKV